MLDQNQAEAMRELLELRKAEELASMARPGLELQWPWTAVAEEQTESEMQVEPVDRMAVITALRAEMVAPMASGEQ